MRTVRNDSRTSTGRTNWLPDRQNAASQASDDPETPEPLRNCPQLLRGTHTGNLTKLMPRWDLHFGGPDDDRKNATAPHITFRPRLGGYRQCGLVICTFHLGFSLVLQRRVIR